MNRRLLTITLLAAVLALPARAEFSDLANALEDHVGHRTWIPMFGMVRSMIRVVHPRGVHDLQLAVFEEARRVDAVEVERLFTKHVGKGFSPLVKVRSKHETTLIYAKPINPDLVELVVFAQDGGDTVLVRVAVDADAVSHAINENPRRVALLARK